jgi:outer membrane receptor protein involved in Fe transport
MARVGLSCGSSIVALLGAAGLLSAPAISVAAEPGVNVAITSGPLDKALLSLGAQSRTTIVFDSGLVSGLTAPALSGRFSVRQALERLLAGRPIEIVETHAGQFVLRAARTPVITLPSQQPVSLNNDPVQAADLADSTMVEEIVVGSHIRGVADGPSPVLVVSRDEIDRGGYGTLADALTALPQAFGGSASDDARTTATDPTTTNDTRATGFNLRGLGADATLVLVNGRRVAGSGLMGDFADVSSIPLAAVARVEVLLDGASALYGSDAVGGVVNIVMRERFDGAETRLRLGATTAGGASQRQLAQTFGRSWDTGSVLFSAEYQRRDRLRAIDRSFTGDADLRSLGGTDHRLNFAQPGNVIGIDPATGISGPRWAIPSGQDGTALKPSDFIPGQINRANYRATLDILPTQERGSAYLAVVQDLGPRLTVTADARYSDRRYTTHVNPPQTTLTVSRANPYFVSPNGAASNSIAYSFQNEAGGLYSTGEVQSRAMSIGAKVRLPHDWRLDLYALHGEELQDSLSTNVVNALYLNEALGNLADNPLTPFSATRDGYFNPFIGQGRNKQAILDFVLSGFEKRRTVGRLDTVSATVDGGLFRLPAGEVRLAFGAQYRTEGLKSTGASLSSTVAPIAAFTRVGERDIGAVFAEARVPLFGGAFRRPGFERLELSLAVRREHYEIGGSATVPKIGILWSPVSALVLKSTYGESFRAPSLGQLNDPQQATPVFISNGVGTVQTLLRYGGNPNLRPETAKSWTAGFELAPAAWQGARLSATLFDTKFNDRIGQPAINNLTTVLTAPDLAPFRQYVSPATNPADLALVQSILATASATAAAAYPATTYQAIAEARYVNTGSFQVRGVDVTAAYPLTIRGDRVMLSANASYLMHFRRRITASAGAVDLAGVVENPADLRGRASTSWTHGPVTTTLSLNYTGALTNPNGPKVSAQTTADLQVQYASPARTGPWRGLVVALTAQNLFAQDPPFFDSRGAVGYDPANYEPIGRVIAFQITKAW